MTAISFDLSDGVATITIQRPRVRNALNQEAVSELVTILDSLRRITSGAQAIVLTGSGSAFCSGIDLRSVDLSSANSKQRAHSGLRASLDPVINLLREHRLPIVAAVNGPAVGAGMSLAVACDIIVAAEEAFFCPSFISLGFIPDAGIVHQLARRIGAGRSLAALLLPERIAAARALEWGLVNAVVPGDDVVSRAQLIGKQLAEGPPHAIRTLRSLHECALT